MSDPPPGTGGGETKEGPAAEQAIADARRRTTPRSQLAHRESFQRLSPDAGVLDDQAFSDDMTTDPDLALSSLVDAHGSSDPGLRELVKRLAGRVVLDLARGDHEPRRGIDKLQRGPWAEGADLDLDASLLSVAEAKAAGRAVALDELVASSWVKSDHALALIVDRSGSMSGERLAAAALAVAVMACRAPGDYSVIAVAKDAVVVKPQDRARSLDAVIDDLLALKGHGTTDLALGIRTAAVQLARSHSPRRIAVMLTDGKATAGEDPIAAARQLDELHVIGPLDEPAAARLARAGGGRYAELDGPSAVPAALLQLLR